MFFLPCCLHKTTQITNQFHRSNHHCNTLPSAEVLSHNHFAAHLTASVLLTADNVTTPSSDYKMNSTHTLSLLSPIRFNIISLTKVHFLPEAWGSSGVLCRANRPFIFVLWTMHISLPGAFPEPQACSTQDKSDFRRIQSCPLQQLHLALLLCTLTKISLMLETRWLQLRPLFHLTIP